MGKKKLLRDLKDNIEITKAYERMFQFVPQPEIIHIGVNDRAGHEFQTPLDDGLLSRSHAGIHTTLCGKHVLSSYVRIDERQFDQVECPLCLVRFKELQDLFEELCDGADISAHP